MSGTTLSAHVARTGLLAAALLAMSAGPIPDRASTGLDASASPTATASGTESRFTGRVAGWWVDELGHVSFRLEVKDGERQRSLWFRTPTDRSAATRLEDLTLEAVLSLRGEDDRAITVLCDRSNEDHGKTVADAIPLHGFGQP